MKKYAETILAIAREKLPAGLSLKIPALRHDVAALHEILDIAGENRIFVQFDAQDPDTAEETMRTIERAASRYRRIGCTLPSRWRRSRHDAERVAAMRIAVRLVKGMWNDPSGPVPDCRSAFLELVDGLANRIPLLAVATHDTSLARESLKRLTSAAMPCELQVMLGLPLGVSVSARDLGVPVRMYIPYGTPYLPYSIVHLTHRPMIGAWLVRDICVGRHKRIYNSSWSTGHAGL